MATNTTTSVRRFMERAIREARKNLVRPAGGPFGACIVKDGRIVAAARNTVLANDATCHAEVNAIRKASKKLRTFDLTGCEIYSTTEPCPMCFGAIHWARIGAVHYGTGIRDAARAGFHELRISNEDMRALGRSKIRLVPGFMRDECLELFASWLVLPEKASY
jgi:guanine deaminase